MSYVHPSAERLRLDTHDKQQEKQSPVASASGTNTAMKSAPPTPTFQSPLPSRRTSLSANSPSTTPRPSHLHRTSSSASTGRPPSSPVLARRASRTSLGGAVDDERRPTPKRSISNLIAGLREAQSTMEPIEEPIPLTAPQIAVEHFTRELLGHIQPDTDAETMVILHDACYGHRYSRLKTTKSTLSMIVERPERIHASILGASTAYVRLGGHHAGGKYAPHPDRRELSRPPFRIRRSGRILDITSSYVTNVHGTSWMGELNRMCHSAAEKLAAGVKELSRSPMPGEPEQRTLHEGDLYLAPESLDAFQGALGGVADAVDAVFHESTPTRRAFVAVRPPGHHCSADHPSGFCWLNNVHVGIEYGAQTYGLTHAAILDFDLHHGDGSQAITWQRNSRNEQKRLMPKQFSKSKLAPDIGYYSIHDINSYPCEAGDDEKVQAASLCIDNAHGQSIWNVHLQPWKTQAEFWELYESRYQILLEKAKQFLQLHSARIRAEGKIQPKAAIFISAGFDASEWEGEGMQRHKVNVPTEFYARFTKEVVQLAQENELGCDGRVISVLEGGYSDRALCSGVLSHLSGLCTNPVTAATRGVGSILGLSEQLNSMSIGGMSNGDTPTYDQSWWSASNLTALEMKVNPPPPPLPGKKIRAGPQPTYATPTESFAYKVIDANKFARSVSGTMREAPTPVRPPTPPAPEVDWIVATQELSKLLIPIDRQTKSCTPEELAGVRVKKDRQSAGPVLTSNESTAPRQLRDRRVKGAASAASTLSDDAEPLRSVSRSSRRETIAVLPSADEPTKPARRASRRLSAGSTLSLSTPEADIDAPPVPPVPSQTSDSPDRGAMGPPTIPAVGAVQVKKIRVPTKPRKVLDSTPLSLPAPVSATALTSGVVGNPSAASDIANQDIDNLAAGMKKVTLKVSSTKEEHDRKQKEKLDADRRARALKAAETRRVNAAAKKAAAEGKPAITSAPKRQPTVTKTPPLRMGVPPPSATFASPTTAHNGPLSVSTETPVGGHMLSTDPTSAGEGERQAADIQSATMDKPKGFMLETHLQPVAPVNMSAQQPAAPNPIGLTNHSGHVMQPPASFQSATPSHSEAAPLSIGSIPETSSTSQAPALSGTVISPSEEQAPIPLNISTHAPNDGLYGDAPSTPSRGGKQLPVWSSTGPIPFSSSGVASLVSRPPQPPPSHSVSNGLWNPINSEVDLPKSSGRGAEGHGIAGEAVAESERHDNTTTSTNAQDMKSEGRADANIWDIPETPGK